MKIINFYKASSRLGLINIPYHGTELNVGVEEAPDYILSDNFLSKYETKKIISFSFPKPESIKKTDYLKIMADSSVKFSQIIIENQRQNQGTQVVIGGDHSVALSSVLAQLQLNRPESLGFIQIDSHSDINNYLESPSKNFHGMVVRALCDPDFDDKHISNIPIHLPIENIMYVGNLEIDWGEKKFIKKNKIPIINRTEIVNNRNKVINKIFNFCESFMHIHLSFDIDVFDISLASATGTPSKNGLFKEDIFFILDILSKKNLSIDLVEVNPRKIGAESTIKLAQEVLNKLLT